MANQIGLAAVLQTSNFTRGLGIYLSGLNRMDLQTGDVATGLTTQFLGLGNSILSLGATAAKVAAGGLAVLGAALTGFAVTGIGKAADLDQQLANIAATMNTTKEAIDPLKDLIFDLSLSPQLTVNAEQAAEAIELLARNGLTMTQILEGAAEATVALANATGADFGVAADVATDVMALFNIEAEDMAQAIDAITGVTTNSKFTIDDFRLALAQAGGVTAGIGVSLEDLSTVLVATSSAFASGSDAGTSFRTLLTRLSDPTQEIQDLMEEYNISLFDSAGNTRSLAELSGQLNTAFSGLTQAEQARIAAQLGGADAARTVLELSKLTREEFEALGVEVNESGQAFRAAATRVDSLKGAFEIFRGIIEAVQIQVGDKFLPILRGLTVGFTDLAGVVGPKVIGFFEEVAGGIENLLGIAGQFQAGFLSDFGSDFGTLGQVLSGIEEVLDNFLPEDVLQKVFDFNDALGILARTITDDVVLAIETLTNLFETIVIPGSIDFLTNTVLPNLTLALQFVNENWEAFRGALLGIGAVLAGAAIAAAITAIVAAVGALLTPIAALVAGAALLGAAWTTNFLGIQDIVKQVGEIILSVFNAIRAVVINQTLPALQEAFANLTEALNALGIDWNDVLDALLAATVIVFAAIGVAIVAVVGIITALVNAVANGVATMTSFWGELGEAVGTIFEGIVTAITGAAEVIKGIVAGDLSQVLGGLALIWEGNVTFIIGLFDLIATTIQATLATALSVVEGFVTGIIGFFTILKDTLVGNSIIPDMVNAIITLFESLAGPVGSALSSIADLVGTVFGGLLGTGSVDIDFGGIGTNILQARTKVADFNDELRESIDLLDKLQNILDTTFRKVVLLFEKTVTPIFNGLTQTFNSFVENFLKLQEDILPGAARAFNEFGDEAGEVFESMRADIEGAAVAISNMAANLSAMVGALQAISTEAGIAFGELQTLNNVNLSGIQSALNSLRDRLDDVRGVASDVLDRMSSIAGTNLDPLISAISTLSGALNSANTAAQNAKVAFDALATADFGNFSTLAGQVNSLVPSLNNLAIAAGQAAGGLITIQLTNFGGVIGQVNALIDAINDLTGAALEAAAAVASIGAPGGTIPTATSIPQGSTLAQPVTSTLSQPIVQFTGPITISNGMDLAILEAFVKNAITEAFV